MFETSISGFIFICPVCRLLRTKAGSKMQFLYRQRTTTFAFCKNYLLSNVLLIFSKFR